MTDILLLILLFLSLGFIILANLKKKERKVKIATLGCFIGAELILMMIVLSPIIMMILLIFAFLVIAYLLEKT